MTIRFVSAGYLQRTALWEGSLERLTWERGGLPLEDVKAKAARLEGCDDRTPKEEEYLRALRLTIADPLGLREPKV